MTSKFLNLKEGEDFSPPTLIELVRKRSEVVGWVAAIDHFRYFPVVHRQPLFFFIFCFNHTQIKSSFFVWLMKKRKLESETKEPALEPSRASSDESSREALYLKVRLGCQPSAMCVCVLFV